MLPRLPSSSLLPLLPPTTTHSRTHFILCVQLNISHAHEVYTMPNTIHYTMFNYLNATRAQAQSNRSVPDFANGNSSIEWSYFELFGRFVPVQPVQMQLCILFFFPFCKPMSPSSSLPSNAVRKLNKYIDTFSEFMFVHRFAFHITFSGFFFFLFFLFLLSFHFLCEL